MDELSPIFRALSEHPVNFVGGFVAGLLRLNLAEDPVKSWLRDQAGQGGVRASMGSDGTPATSNGKGPQSIAID
jgi:hypothetical protein